MSDKIEGPYFLCKKTSVGKTVKFITKKSDGTVVEMEVWELVNKFGPEKVLQMRENLPEIEDE